MTVAGGTVVIAPGTVVTIVGADEYVSTAPPQAGTQAGRQAGAGVGRRDQQFAQPAEPAAIAATADKIRKLFMACYSNERGRFRGESSWWARQLYLARGDVQGRPVDFSRHVEKMPCRC
jgi:hypothetical protein